MVPWLRDLKFCATIFVLALWAFLISSKKKDHLLLMLSGALGILFTGEAIGESLQHLATPNQITWLSRAGSLILLAVNIAFLYLWWAAFRQEAHQRTAPRTAHP
jgi:ABC-type enterochelin transport system permease subunit